MKTITMFILQDCPYCKQAVSWMEELKKENSNYESINLTIIDEGRQPDLAATYDYYYVPTYYIDKIKVHEGVATKSIVKDIFERTLE